MNCPYNFVVVGGVCLVSFAPGSINKTSVVIVKVLIAIQTLNTLSFKNIPDKCCGEMHS